MHRVRRSRSRCRRGRSPRRPGRRPRRSARRSAPTSPRSRRARARAHVLGELALEVGHLVRAVADAVVAEDVLAADDAGRAPRAPRRRAPCRRGTSGRSGRVRAGGPPSRARRRSMLVSVTSLILDTGPRPRNGAAARWQAWRRPTAQGPAERSPADSLPALALEQPRARLLDLGPGCDLGDADFPECAAGSPVVRRGA